MMYDSLLLLISLIAFPKLVYQLIFHKKYRSSLWKRFGIGVPRIEKGTRSLIWVHAVSMGETKAVASLAKKLKKDKNNPILMFTTVTETGLAEGKKSIPEADYHFFLPFDFNWIIAPIVKRIRPDLIVLCETDFWYNFLRAGKKNGAQIAVVNGKISERSLHRFLKFSTFSRSLFSLIDLFCIQSIHYKERFEKLGISQDKIVVTGNIKFDSHFPKLEEEALDEWKQKLGIKPSHKVLVAGSTHDPEEKLIIDACKPIWDVGVPMKVLMVPRHPERFDEVARILEKKEVPYTRYSDLHDNGAKVILVDAMGVLCQCYQLATVALVAGSYTPKVGGHNIVEPSWYGIPVIFGPYLHSQPELLELVKDYHSGLQLEPDVLSVTLSRLLEDSEERKALGDAGTNLVNDLKGATQATYDSLVKILK